MKIFNKRTSLTNVYYNNISMKNLISLIFLFVSLLTFSQNAPVANDQAVSVNEGATLTGNLTGSDADDDALTYAVVGSPSSGSVSIEAND